MVSTGVVVLVVAWCYLAGLAWAAEPPVSSPLPAPLPWGVQRDVIEGWTITALERHEGFVRLTLRRGNDETQVEVDPSSGQGEWSIRSYRVQPAPGYGPPEDLLRATLDDLREWEQRSGHTPFLVSLPHQHGIFDPKDLGTGQSIICFIFWLLLVMAALFTAVTLWRQGKETPRDRRIILTIAGVLIGVSTIIVLVFLLPTSIPAHWIVTLKNGSTRNSIGRIFGRDLHTGPGYGFLMDLLAPGPGERMRGMVRTNLWLSGVNSMLFGCLAWTLVGGIWAPVMLTLWFAANWAFVNAACSELPSQMLTLMVFVGAIAVRHVRLARFTDSEGPSRTLRLLARESGLLLLFLLAIWGWTLRPEFGLLGALVLLSVLLQRWTPSLAQPEGTSLQLSPLVRRAFQNPLIRLVAVLAVCGAYRFLDTRLEPQFRWVLRGLMPFDESTFTLPLAMTLFLPPALVGLMVIGFWRGIREGDAWCGLAIALLVLHKLYVAVDAYGPSVFELLRRWTAMAPAAMLFAAVGWQRVAQPHQRWRNLLLTLSLLLPWSWQHYFWPLSLAISRVAIRCGFAAILCWPEIAFFLSRTFRLGHPPSAPVRIAAWQWFFSAMLAGFLLWLPTQCPPVPYDHWREHLLHPPGYLLATNQVREVRFLIEALDRNPGTVLVAEVWRDGQESRGGAHDWTFVGGGLEQPLDVPRDNLSLRQVVAASVPFARRVLFYRGLDCNLPGEQACLDLPGKLLMEERFVSAPSSEVELRLLPAGTEVTLSLREMAP